jgi:hypothetical protein
MKLRRGAPALAAVALLFLNLRASAQTSAPSSDEPKEAAPPATAGPLATAAPYVGFAPPPDPLRIENSSASASIQFGFLAQPQFEMVGAPDADLTTKNLFLRRIRFMVGGRVLKNFDYFFDTDYPDLFKVDPANQSGGTGKNAPGLNVQDAFVTFKPAGNLFKADTGFMLPPLSHNGVQGAGTLYGPDYFVNTFRRNVLSNIDPFGSSGQSPAGRDLGVQVRGLVLEDHLEYRVGIFQGERVGPLPAMGTGTAGVVGGNNFFRVATRVQVNVLDAESGFFYQGTYLGTKKILSFGAFYDFEDQYKYKGVDAIVDLPAGPGIVTAQADFVQWDGGNFLQTLPKSTALMAEAGYLIRPIMLSPIGRVERLSVAQPTAVSPNEDRYGGGVAFWPYGHTSNIKAFYAHVHRDPAPHDFSQLNVQWQLYFY